MTVQDLIDLLGDYPPDAPVLIAHQPSWPLAEIVAGVTEDLDDYADGSTVFLVAGGHPWDTSPYAPGSVFETAER